MSTIATTKAGERLGAPSVRVRTSGPAIAAAVIGTITALTVARYAPPSPAPADAPAPMFSAERAAGVLREVIGPPAPRPSGSDANAAVRDRIVLHLAGLGYTPEVQRELTCSGYGQALCVPTANVVARIEGTAGPAAVAIAAHYDSVPAGPGIADNGTGVAAVLEIARALRTGGPPRNTIVILLEDGEEAGLIGADAFMERNRSAADVKRLVNLEARGSSGSSVLFETGSGNAALMALYAAHVARPVTSSAFTLVYRLMPSDTSFTAFASRGVSGFNFANVSGTGSHHTAMDTEARVEWGTVQQQGDNALAMVRALAAGDVTAGGDEDAVFFDVLALGTIWWPERWTLALTGAVCLLLAGVIAMLVRQGQVRVSAIVRGMVVWTLTIAGALAVGLLLKVALDLAGAFARPWIARPGPAIAAFWALPLLVVPALARPRAGFVGLWIGTWIMFAVLGLAAAFGAPALSYLFIVPVAAAAVSGLAALRGRDDQSTAWQVAVIAPLAVTAVLWLPIAWVFYDALGATLLPLIAALVTIVVATGAPFLAGSASHLRRPALITGAAGVALLSAIAIVVGRQTTSILPTNLVLHHDATAGTTRWLVETDGAPLPEGIGRTVAFASAPEKPFPWSTERDRAFIGPASSTPVPAPELQVLRTTDRPEGGRVIVGRLRSPRGARDITLLVPPGTRIDSARVAGKRAPIDRGTRWHSGWHMLTCLAVPAEGLEIELTLLDTAPVEIVLTDRSPDLPATKEALTAVRPANAVPYQGGDGMIVTGRLKI